MTDDVEITTWGDLSAGDVVLGVDNRVYYLAQRDGRTFRLRHPDDRREIVGNPPLTQKVIRLLVGEATYARRTLAAGGIVTELLYERMTRS